MSTRADIRQAYLAAGVNIFLLTLVVENLPAEGGAFRGLKVTPLDPGHQRKNHERAIAAWRGEEEAEKVFKGLMSRLGVSHLPFVADNGALFRVELENADDKG